MQFDIIIIGGGLVGATLACMLPSHLRIALIDAAPIDLREDDRLIALNDSSVCLLEQGGLWQSLKPYATSIKQIHVSHKGYFGITRIHASDAGLNALGFVVPAKNMNKVLTERLQTAKNVEFLRPALLKALTQNAESVALSVATAGATKEYTAQWVIGADGSQSTVRELLGIQTKKIDYRQGALVTITELHREHHNIAYERFQSTGAIAMLPLSDKRAATIWTAPNATIAELMQLSDVTFLSQLQKQFGYRLGRFVQINKRSVYPLQMLRAEQARKDRVLLIGNAAHTVHPIAASGLNWALYEVAHVLEYFLENGQDGTFLQKTEKIKRGPFPSKNFNQHLSHNLISLFSNDFFMVNIARQMGMLGLDLFTGAKKRFVQHSIGRIGHVPASIIRKNG